MSGYEGIGLAAFDALPGEEVRRALLACCSSPRWAAEVAARRPYGSIEALYAAAAEVLAGLDETDIDAALAGHPRIGDRLEGDGHAWSRGEQAGVAEAGEDVRRRLVAGNRAYEERFGRVYLVCASGRSGAELLALLEERLQHDEETERRVTTEELGKINRLRLARLVGHRPQSNAHDHEGSSVP